MMMMRMLVRIDDDADEDASNAALAIMARLYTVGQKCGFPIFQYVENRDRDI